MTGYLRPHWPCVEGFEGSLPSIGVARPVDFPQGCSNSAAVLVGDVVQRGAQQVDNAGLHLGPREHGGDRLGEALQAVDDGDEDVLDAAVPELVHDAQPELATLGLLDPQPQHLLGAVRADAKGNIDGFIPNGALVADLDPERVEEHQRVQRLERAVLPFGHFIEDGVGDRADQVG